MNQRFWFLVIFVFCGGNGFSCGAETHHKLSFSLVNGDAVVLAPTAGECSVELISTGRLEIPATLLGHKVVAIGRSAFKKCGWLTEVFIPDSVTNIGNYAFEGCAMMKSVSIPSGVENIGDGAFEDCASLTDVKLPESLSCIRYGLFRGCRELSYVEIPQTVTNVEPRAFDGTKFESCSQSGFVVYGSVLCGYRGDPPQHIVIPPGVKTIENFALSGCAKVESLTIPDGVVSIGESAFRDCASLATVEISRTVERIGAGAFTLCPRLTALNVDGRNGIYSSMDGVLYDRVRRSLLLCPQGKDSLPIKTGTRSIAALACNVCTNIVSVSIPVGVESVGEAAFSSCVSLSRVFLPSTVRKIDQEVFSGCVALSCIYVEKGDSERVRNMLRQSGCDVGVLTFEEQVVLKVR